MASKMIGRKWGQIHNKWKIVRGDEVKVISGYDQGQTGVVTRVLRKQNRVIVEGLNRVTKHIKGTAAGPGSKTKIEAPIHVSNVQLLERAAPKEPGGEAELIGVRVGFKFLSDGTKVRVSRGSRASGNIIPRPGVLTERKWARPTTDGPKDTIKEAVLRNSFAAMGLAGNSPVPKPAAQEGKPTETESR